MGDDPSAEHGGTGGATDGGGGGGGKVSLGDRLRGLVGGGGDRGAPPDRGSLKQPLLNEAFSVEAGGTSEEEEENYVDAADVEEEAEEPSPYASIIRERYLRQQAAERAKEQAQAGAAAATTTEATTTSTDAAGAGSSGASKNRDRAESTPESLDIDVDSGPMEADEASLARRNELNELNEGDWAAGGGSAAARGGPRDKSSEEEEEGSARDRYSLAFSPATSCCARLLIPLLIVLTHLLFIYGQFAPMWRLRLFAHVDAWANATQPVARRTVEALGLPWRNRITYDHDGDVETFTYGFAIQKLWAAEGMPSTFGPRLSAVLLVLFSGAWPHVKLLLLHLNFWVRRRAEARTGALYWLSGFGKYSLADVLVVCVMIAIVHLDWEVDPAAIRDGVGRDLPLLVNIAKKMYTPLQACDQLLNEPCSTHESLKCWTCNRAVSIMMDHPDWAQGAGQDVLRGFETSGGGQASLRIAGMRGIYVFCAAATLSLLIGVAVDWLDHRARRHRAREQEEAPLETVTFSSSIEEMAPPEERPSQAGAPSRASRRSRRARRHAQRRARRSAAAAALTEPLRHGAHSLPPRGPTLHLLNRVPAGSPFSSEHSYTLLFFVSLFAGVMVLLATFRPTMERRVYGAIPKLLEEVLGVRWYRQFSLETLTEVTGDAGGPDYLLMGTFALFILVGPILRAILCAMLLAFPFSEVAHERLTYAVNVLGAFCAWDVLGIAAFMVMLEMPSITDTILVRPECALVPGDAVGGKCLEVQFNLLGGFYGLVLLGGSLLLAVSLAAVRMGMRATDPYGDGDGGGPYLCGCLLPGGCCRPGTAGGGCCRRKRGRRARGVEGWEGAHGYSRLGGGEEGRNIV